MGLFFGQLFFDQPTVEAGWSEGFYFDSTDYSAALGQMRVLGTMRIAMLTNKVAVTYMRVSDPEVKRDVFIEGDPNSEGMGDGEYTPTTGTADTTYPDIALLYRATTAAGKFGLHYIRGIPESCITNGFYTPQPNWTLALNTFLDEVKSNTLQRIKAGNPPVATYTAIDRANVERITRRKVGRPFGQPVGRSRRP
jgi:hypothetical protein